jgi:hypothetical protein
LLHPDFVLPVVVEVVLIKKPLTHPELEVRQVNRLRVIVKRQTSPVAHAIVFPVNVEAVQMGVGPTEGNLECIVEIGDRAVTANQQSPPDDGTDASQKNA